MEEVIMMFLWLRMGELMDMGGGMEVLDVVGDVV